MQRWILLGAVAAGCALAGCKPANDAQVRQQVQGMRQELGNAADAARKTAADATLAASVKSALSSRKGLDAHNIDVEAHGSHVILKGDVSAPEQATMAEEVARQIKGVQDVTDQLTMRIPAKSGASAGSAGAGTDAATPAANGPASDAGSPPLANPQPTVTH